MLNEKMLDCERFAFDFQFHEQKTLRWKTMTLCLMILHHDPSYTRIPIPILPFVPCPNQTGAIDCPIPTLFDKSASF